MRRGACYCSSLVFVVWSQADERGWVVSYKMNRANGSTREILVRASEDDKYPQPVHSFAIYPKIVFVSHRQDKTQHRYYCTYPLPPSPTQTTPAVVPHTGDESTTRDDSFNGVDRGDSGDAAGLRSGVGLAAPASACGDSGG